LLNGDHMITSRRGFLRSLGAGTAAGVAVHWPLTGTFRAASLEPSRLGQDNGVIRLNSNENAYGPSAKVVEVMNSSIRSANRYPRIGAPRLRIYGDSSHDCFRLSRQREATHPTFTHIRSHRTLRAWCRF